MKACEFERFHYITRRGYQPDSTTPIYGYCVVGALAESAGINIPVDVNSGVEAEEYRGKIYPEGMGAFPDEAKPKIKSLRENILKHYKRLTLEVLDALQHANDHGDWITVNDLLKKHRCHKAACKFATRKGHK